MGRPEDQQIHGDQEEGGKIRPHDPEEEGQQHHGQQGQVLSLSGGVRGAEKPDDQSHEDDNVEMIACLRHARPGVPGGDQLREEKDRVQKSVFLLRPGQQDKDQVGEDRQNDIAVINIIVGAAAGNKGKQVIGYVGK